MARGKHAVRSANRRAEAIDGRISQLEDELAQAKKRARRCEADAERVPRLVEEVERLRRQTDQHTSDRIDDLLAKMRSERDQSRTQRLELARWVYALADQYEHKLRPDEWDKLVRLSGAAALADLDQGRHLNTRQGVRNSAKGNRAWKAGLSRYYRPPDTSDTDTRKDPTP